MGNSPKDPGYRWFYGIKTGDRLRHPGAALRSSVYVVMPTHYAGTQKN
jgi:hypothetical protein